VSVNGSENGEAASVKVRGFTVIRDVFGADVVDVEVPAPRTIGALLEALLRQFGEPLKEKLWDPEAGELTPFLIRLNDEIISSTLDRDKPVISGDEIAIIFPIGGG
jgi:molybdopterin converting factor small subunit